MSSDKSAESAKGGAARSGITIALINVLPPLLTAIAGIFAGYKLIPPAAPPPPEPMVQSPPPTKNDQEEADINRVHGTITVAKTQPNGVVLDCQGTIRNLKPESQHLWLAVEDNGHIFFKRSEFGFNAERTTWKAAIKQEGQSNSVALLLYVATDNGNAQIEAWLKDGEDHGNKFDEITSIRGTYPLDHRDHVQVK